MKRKNKLILLTALSALFVTAFLGSCKKDKYIAVDSVCPAVTKTDPANLATVVPLNKTITATFNEKMNASTITASSFTVSEGSTAISGSVSYDALSLTMSFVPASTLTPG